MSVLDIGLHDVSEHTQAFKDKLASKDGHIAAQEARLVKQAAEIEELKGHLNEAVQQLARETNQVLELESVLRVRSEDLRNERMTSQNIAQVLEATQQQVNEKDRQARELQADLQSLSHTSDSHHERCTKLEREKTALEAHIRDLRSNLSQLSFAPPVTTSTNKRLANRPRSSSVSDSRILSLEQELKNLRGLIQKRDTELEHAHDQFLQAKNEMIRVSNDKLAMEKKTSHLISELQTSVEEKEEELTCLRGLVGDGNRERELMDRIEEDSAKIAVLERLIGEGRDVMRLKETLRRVGEELENERRRVMECEARQVELVRERNKALDDLEQARHVMQASLQERETEWKNDNRLPSNVPVLVIPSDETAIAGTERLLAAIERLRAERDALRRDMVFLETEHKFAIEALEASRLVGSIPCMTMNGDSLSSFSPKENGPDFPHPRNVQKLRLALNTSAIVLHYFSSRDEVLERQACNILASRDEAQTRLDGTHRTVERLRERIDELETNVKDHALSLETAVTQRDKLVSHLEAKETEHDEEIACLNGAHQQTREDLAQAAKLVEILESERDTFKLQVTNLLTDLQTTQDKLTKAESHYTELQFHQLSSMSSNEANQVLRERITELEGRVMRRTELVGIQQHDIKRMETNLKLQEERLMEMTAELEMMSAQKHAMVEDCADARDARDSALARLEAMEVTAELRAEEADKTVEALVGVILHTVANGRGAVLASLRVAASLRTSLQDEQRRNAAEKDTLTTAEADARLSVRQHAVALAISQGGAAKALAAAKDLTDERNLLQKRAEHLQSKFDQEAAETQSLKAHLDALQLNLTTAEIDFCRQRSAFENEIQDLRDAGIEGECRHQEVVRELQLSKDSLQVNFDEAQQALAARTTDEEIALLRKRHSDEIEGVQSRLIVAERALEDQKSAHRSLTAELEASLANSRELERQLAETSEQLRQCTIRLERAEHNHDELVSLRERLNETLSKVADLTEARDSLQTSYGCLVDELSRTRNNAEARNTELSDQYLETKQELENELIVLRKVVDEQKDKLDVAMQEAARLSCHLTEESELRMADRRQYNEDLVDARQQRDKAGTALAGLRQQAEATQAQLDESKVKMEALDGEKRLFQEEITTLEAAIQRHISMYRHQESQMKESETKMSMLRAELDQLQNNLTLSEKIAKAAEVNLSLYSAQHKREVAELQRQLSTLQSQPNLQAALRGLEERNNEMEELLRTKCAEIEANDDRVLEMLKENKKLANKVESLTRKVQNLQTKLAAAKASVPKAGETSSKLEAVSPRPEHIDVGLSSPRQSSIPTTPSVIPPVFRETSSSRCHPHGSPSTLPMLHPIPHTPSHVLSPNNDTSLHRAVSGPSLSRPKTPENQPIKPILVFKAKTPEKKLVPPMIPLPMQSTSTIGKKRPAPDDFESCEGVPPQGFTPDSLPSHDPVESTTPRLRRALSSLHGGFTPKRHQNSRPTTIISSPRRATTGASMRPSPIIADVTNSPRGSSSQAIGPPSRDKKSWLGKIRGQTTSKNADNVRATFGRDS